MKKLFTNVQNARIHRLQALGRLHKNSAICDLSITKTIIGLISGLPTQRTVRARAT
jgi:hypothetical protein